MRNDQCADIEPASPVYARARALPQMERGVGATEMGSGAAAQVTLSPPALPCPTPSPPCTWKIRLVCQEFQTGTSPIRDSAMQLSINGPIDECEAMAMAMTASVRTAFLEEANVKQLQTEREEQVRA